LTPAPGQRDNVEPGGRGMTDHQSVKRKMPKKDEEPEKTPQKHESHISISSHF